MCQQPLSEWSNLFWSQWQWLCLPVSCWLWGNNLWKWYTLPLFALSLTYCTTPSKLVFMQPIIPLHSHAVTYHFTAVHDVTITLCCILAWICVILSRTKIVLWINPNPIGGGGAFWPPCRFFRRASRPIGISRSNFMTFFSQVSRIFWYIIHLGRTYRTYFGGR